MNPLSNPATLNLNWKVRIQLTEDGREIVTRKNQEIREMLSAYVGDAEWAHKDHYKVMSNSELTLQLWEAFHLFGGENMPGYATSVGIPFATNFEIFPI